MRIVQDEGQQPEAVFSRWVRDLRDQQGLSQAALGSEVGLDPTAITRIERGQRSVRLNEAVAIANALGHTLTAMVAGPPKPSLRSLISRNQDQLAQIDDVLRGQMATRDRIVEELDHLRKLQEDQDDGERSPSP